MLALPPPLARLYNTPFAQSEMPSGFSQVDVTALPADPRYRTLGAIRFDFKSANVSETASYVLFRTSAQAAAFSRVEAKLNTGGFFRIRAASLGRIVIGVTGKTQSQANAFLQLALGHLRRSER